jgi:hypothetical protein
VGAWAKLAVIPQMRTVEAMSNPRAWDFPSLTRHLGPDTERTFCATVPFGLIVISRRRGSSLPCDNSPGYATVIERFSSWRIILEVPFLSVAP